MDTKELEQNKICSVLQRMPIKNQEKLFEIRKIKFDINCIFNFSQEKQKPEKRYLDDITKEIKQLSSEEKIIVCDIVNLQKSKLFILCVNSIIIISNKSTIRYLNDIFTKATNIHFLAEISTNDLFLTEISEILKIKQSYSNLISTDDIEFFESNLHFRATKGNETFLSLIQTTVSKYILLKSFYRTKFYRHKNEIRSIKDFCYDDFIFIRNEGSSSNLYFNVNDQLLYILKKFNSNDYDTKKRYEREIECYRKIDNKHPFISKYFGEFEMHDNKYIVIEYIEGQTLKTLNNKNKMKLSFEEKIKIIIQILLSVEYFHIKGIILRDLKWDNIIIDSNHDCFLIDFDFSKQNVSDYDEMTSDIGSNLFSAPEQLMSNDYSYQVDLFSVGMIINFIINEEFIDGKDFLDDLNNEIPKFPGTFLFLTPLYRDLLSNSPEKRPNISTVLNNFLLKIPQYIAYYIICVKNNNIQEMIKKFVKIRCQFLLEINQNESNTSSFIDLSEIYYFLSRTYESDENKNIEKYFYYCNLSANLNNSKAQRSLGIFYSNGKYITPDINIALKYLNLSANQNNSYALYDLGDFYFHRKIVQKDLNKANYYFSLAGKTDDYIILISLSEHYINNIPRDKNKSFYYAKLGSKVHCPISQIRLGMFYATNEYVPKDMDKFLHYFSLAANQHHFLATFVLGISDSNDNYFMSIFRKIAQMEIELMPQVNYRYFGLEYYLGDIKKRNISLAIFYFNLSAKKNDPVSQYYLGEIYMQEEKFRDINKSIYYLTLSSNNNYPPAQYILGVNYYIGQYFERNVNKSFYYLNLSAKSNYSFAQCYLGYLYIFGKDVAKDINKGIYYLNLAANQNNPKAQYLIGFINLENSYVPRDLNKAIHYLKLSADQQNSNAQFYLGLIYYYELKDSSKAVYYLNLSANQNYHLALFALGKIYFYGLYIKKNIKEAIRLFELASNRNVDDASLYLGIIHYEGKYLEKNIEKSISYLTLSAKANNSYAQYFLGEIYYFKEKDENINKSIYYLKLAAKQNNPFANYFLGVLFFKGKYIQKDLDKSIKYFKNASNSGIKFAKNNLGCIYFNTNISLSIEYFNENIKISEDILSICNLAKIYYFGINWVRDVPKAIHLLKIGFKQQFFVADLFLLLILQNEKMIDESKLYYNLIKEKYKFCFLYIYLDEKIAEYSLNLLRNMSFDYGLTIKHSLNFLKKFINIELPGTQKVKKNIMHQRKNINNDFFVGFGLFGKSFKSF